MKRAIALITAALLAGCATTPSTILLQPTPVVKVVVGDGHGSGAYIGNGIVITAAHVVLDVKTVQLISERNLVQTGTVLWANTDYDIAAIKVSNASQYLAAHLVCRSPKVGEALTAAGSPMDQDFLYIPGTVAGAARDIGKIKNVVIAALPITFGNSGGPVFDDYGDMVGVVSALMASSIGGTPSQTGISYVVPADTVCMLMGRV